MMEVMNELCPRAIGLSRSSTHLGRINKILTHHKLQIFKKVNFWKKR
jgi:hypothetical protein